MGLAAAGLAALALLALIRAGPASAWLACLMLAAAAVGLAAGAARVAAIDGGALTLPAGSDVDVRGFVSAPPRRSAGEVDVRVETPDGRLLVRAPEPVPDLAPGTAVRASGRIGDPADWERGWLERLGIHDVLAAREVEVVPGSRGGITGMLDRVRGRAEATLDTGTGPEAAALLRGFVLGEDDRIDERVRDDFKRSGLAHLLAVSGQNVILLAVLAAGLLAAAGVRLRARLGWVLLAIAVYVPVAGGGASIQRAGVMGAAGVVAALAGRPASRWYALLLAAAVTLAMDPRASADIGWQLSFAAVVGILLLCGPLAAALAGSGGRWRRTLAEGAALTISATLATAPLMAFHFGTFSIVTLPANLAALPAEAPVMWLGMLAAAAGQVPWLPAAPLSWLGGALAGYIAQVAHWFAAPGWAQADAAVGGPAALLAVYVALAVAVALALRTVRRRRGFAAPRQATVGLALAVLAVAALAGWRIAGDSRAGGEPGLRLTVLDVGQGDSILLEPEHGGSVLVDAGPAEAQVAGQLLARGVDHLGMLVITHPEADHEGGAAAVLEQIPTRRLVFARASAATIAVARASGTELERVAAGARLGSGDLRLDVLWPPAQRLAARAAARAQPNLVAIVMVARWHGFDALLTADAEAEAAPVDPGDVELLKVAHHGSEDAGLEALVGRSDPELAVISVGTGNPYGHPTAATLATLAEDGVPVLRTDMVGAVTVEVRDDGWGVR